MQNAKIKDLYPLSPMQQGMLFHKIYQPTSEDYNTQLSWVIDGDLDHSLFKKAWQSVVDRFEIFRTTFHWEELEKPLQAVHEKVDLPWIEEDWSGDDDTERFEAFLKADRQKGFNFEEAPLMRMHVFKLGEKKWRFVWSHHHILLDGWSLPQVLKAVFENYRALTEGKILPAVPVFIYRDYIAWLGKKDPAEATAYWKELLAGFESASKLGIERASGDSQSDTHAESEITLSRALTGKLKALCQQQGLTLSTALQGIWGLLVSRYSGNKDIVFGVTVSGRPAELAHVEDAVGLFINTLPVRVEVQDTQSVKDYLKQFQEQLSKSRQFEYSPLWEIQALSEVGAGKPLFEQIFVFENYPLDLIKNQFNRRSEIQICDVRSHDRTNYAMTVSATEKDGLWISLDYTLSRFDKITVDRMLGSLQTMLEGWVSAPGAKVCDLPILREDEKQKILGEWNNTDRVYPKHRFVHELFEEQVEKTPDAIAVVFGSEKLTYQELNEKSNQLAHALRNRGIQQDQIVPLCLERSLEQIVGILGILKSGGAYAPLDPHQPKSRFLEILSEIEAPVLVTHSICAEKLMQVRGLEYLILDDAKSDFTSLPYSNLPDVERSTLQLAYVLYTSGSTGKPKGVMSSHRGLCNLISWYHDILKVQESDRSLQFASYTFDMFGEEIWPYVTKGGSVYIVDDATRLDVTTLKKFILENAITIGIFPPVLGEVLLGEEWPPESRVRLLNVGGDRIQIYPNPKLPFDVWNTYGPTEASIDVICQSIKSEDTKGDRPSSPPIGYPISNTKAYILDSSLSLVPQGVCGELYVSGDGLARGYLNRPDLTAERFIPNPFSETAGERMYQTGDLARFLPGGNIECLGRTDTQVKIRGFRIELSEVELALREEERVEIAVVLAREDEPGQKRLVGYLVGQNLNVSELRDGLKKKLPDYMIPSFLMFLDKLPLSPNGKIDRKAFPIPGGERIASEKSYIGPRTGVERQLCEIWKDVLKGEHIGIYDNFFELGGHSLLATQVVSRVRERLHVELKLRQLFEAPTVEALARAIGEQTPGLAGLPLVKISREGDLALSFGQERLWFLDKLEPEASNYLIPCGVRLKGKLDQELLQLSLDQLVARHEVLRTSFREQQGRPVQIIAKDSSFPLQLKNLSHLPNSELEVVMQVREEATKPFVLSQGPLIRGRLLTLGIDDHVLLVTMHHIVSDGWSDSVLFKELGENYQAALEGRKPDLEELTIQYADYSDWQRKSFETEAVKKQAAYWKEKLVGVDILHLPTDRPRPVVQSFAGAKQSVHLNEERAGKLKKYSETSGVSLSMLLLTLFEVLLYRYTGQKNFAIGSPIANRQLKELEGLVGFFVNTIVYRADVSENLAFEELLKRVKHTSISAYENQDVPFEKLVSELNPERDLAYPPLFQVMFVFQNNPRIQLRIGELHLESIEVESTTSKFDLILSFEETEDGVVGEFEYNTELFESATIQRMSEHFNNLIIGILENPKQSIQDLPLLSENEKHQILVEWNDTAREYPRNQCLHELFEEQVTKNPDAIAVVFGDQWLNYNALNEKANQLAHYLRKEGVGPDVRVGICIERSLDMMVGLLGIIKAGGAYVPIDPNYPRDRVDFIIEDSKIGILLTQAKLLEVLPKSLELGTKLICLDRDKAKFASGSIANLGVHPYPKNLAYVLYTSGSTGRPKGVSLTHLSVVTLCHWSQEAFSNQEFGGVLGSTSISWDLSVFELFGTLTRGGRVILVENALQLPELRDIGVTLINTVPSVIRELVKQNQIPDSVITVNLAGEVLDGQLVENIYDSRSKIERVYNLYGPTEDTTYSTFASQPRGLQGNALIGKPVANTSVYLLDSHMQLVPIGIGGELFLVGDGLARGYLNRPDLTAERFIPSPFSDVGERMYRTGDLARYLPDGNIEYLGRIDNQVKIRGFRIELGEIESALQKQNRVESSVVLAREDIPGQKRLVGYIVGESLNITELRDGLKKKLPEYMVPSLFVFLDKLPLMPNGKVDRKALPAPEEGRSKLEKACVAPRTEIEAKLCEIWKDVLNIEQVGIFDNFFELGGDSIISIRIISKANEAGIGIKPKDLFQSPTVAGLAALAKNGKEVLVAREDSGKVVLSPIQHWFFEQKFENLNHWNQATLLSISKNIKLEKLDAALYQLYERHPELRMSYAEHDGKWVQSYREPREWKVIRLGVRNGKFRDQAREIEMRGTEIQSSLDLASGEIFKAALIQGCNDGRTRLLMVIHHLAVDGISWRVLCEDLFEIYQALVFNKNAPLSVAKNTFKDWTRELQKYVHSDEVKKEVDYWLGVRTDEGIWERVTAASAGVKGPASSGITDVALDGIGTVQITLNPEETSQLLYEAQKAYHTQINDLLLTALGLSLWEWTKLGRVLIHLEGHGREDIIQGIDISQTVGWFTTLFPVCLEVEDSSDLGATIRSVKEQLRAIPNKGIGYGVLRYMSHDAELQKSLAQNDRSDICFNYLGQFEKKVSETEEFQLAKESAGASFSEKNHLAYGIDINSHIIRCDDERFVLNLSFGYNKSLYDASMIQKLVESYKKNLRSLIEHCLQPEQGGYTPSDFPLSKINQEKLDFIGRKGIKDLYPLSPMQQLMLLHSIYQPDSEEYMTQESWVIDGDFNESLFRQAWQGVIDDFDIFRTSFHWEGLERPLQCVHEKSLLPWFEEDWTTKDTPETLANFLKEERRRGFDFEQTPLTRIHVLKLEEKKRRFVWTNHHILLDGWSTSQVVRAVFKNYRDLKEGRKLTRIPEFPYKNYIAWIEKKDPQEANDYWKELLTGFESASQLGIERRGAVESENNIRSESKRTVDRSLTDKVIALSQQHGLTISSVLQGMWGMLMSGYSGKKDIVFGVTVSGRPAELPRIEDAVGLFINTLPARVKVRGTQKVMEYLKAFQEQMIHSRQYEYSPLWDIQEQSEIPSGSPLFEQLFFHQNFPAEEIKDALIETKVSDIISCDYWEFPLVIRTVEREGKLSFMLDYKTAIYESEKMDLLLVHWDALLKEWVSAPDATVRELQFLIGLSGQLYK